MIHSAVLHIHKNLNQYLQASFDEQQDVVVVSNVTEHDGSPVAYANNRLVLSLIRIEKDTFPQAKPPGQPMGHDGKRLLHFNLYILLMANFSGERYSEGLEMMSSCIRYFQRTPYYDHGNSPDLDRSIEKLILDVENIDFDQQPGVWNSVGGKCMPSIMYKVRMISVDDIGVEQMPGRLTSTQSTLQKQD
ncbi:MAG: hypothetical protein COB04_02380 [Gammaproteobacteria bacterium]|nr:MAG: hypothetical protein COB04_02380 [Gammaproteobacteria bacterium]